VKFRTILLGLAALFVAFNAAFFSVTGLSSLFAGATTSVIIMASSLELAKLVGASFLYNYWTTINKVLRVYLTMAVFVLIMITSAGIYGYLTSAYQKTSDSFDISNKQTELVETKKSRLETRLTEYNYEKSQLTETINNLSKGLANNVIQYKDKETGEIITTTSRNTRRALQVELTDSKEQRTNLNQKIDAANDSITSYEVQMLQLKVDDTTSAEVGPLRFLAKVSGMEMSSIVNWLTLIIIFVFDPLAVVLIVAFNTALKVDRGLNDKKKAIEHRVLYGETGHPLGNPFGIQVKEIDVVEEEVIIPIEEERVVYERTGWKHAFQGKAFFFHPWFDWGKPERWIDNPDAVKYWMANLGGTPGALKSYRLKNPK